MECHTFTPDDFFAFCFWRWSASTAWAQLNSKQPKSDKYIYFSCCWIFFHCAHILLFTRPRWVESVVLIRFKTTLCFRKKWDSHFQNHFQEVVLVRLDRNAKTTPSDRVEAVASELQWTALSTSLFFVGFPEVTAIHRSYETKVEARAFFWCMFL